MNASGRAMGGGAGGAVWQPATRAIAQPRAISLGLRQTGIEIGLPPARACIAKPAFSTVGSDGESATAACERGPAEATVASHAYERPFSPNPLARRPPASRTDRLERRAGDERAGDRLLA